MEGGEAGGAVGAMLSSIESPGRPRGRPPAGYVWSGGCYVHLASGEPRCQADTRDRFVLRRRRYDRARYWDPKKNVRKQRLARSARKSGRLPEPIQATLETDGQRTRASPNSEEPWAREPSECIIARPTMSASAADCHSALACCQHVQHLQSVVYATIKIPRFISWRNMPKRARVDEAYGAPEALTRAAKAAVSRHGWDELQLAYRTGRLRFMEGVGNKTAAGRARAKGAHHEDGRSLRDSWARSIYCTFPHASGSPNMPVSMLSNAEFGALFLLGAAPRSRLLARRYARCLSRTSETCLA